MVFAVMAFHQRHTFQVLTKRPARMLEYITRTSRSIDFLEKPARAMGTTLKWEGKGMVGWPLPNVWLGISCERQQEADERIPILLNTPAAVRFISAEPLLGSIDLDAATREATIALTGHMRPPPQIGWVIAGGESGPHARPMDPEWMRSLRDQCAGAGVAFFAKQMARKAPIPPDLMVRQFPTRD